MSENKEEFFITWKDGDEKQKAVALSQLSAALENSQPIVRHIQGSNQFQNVYPGNVSIRDEYTRGDYDNYRTYEALPQSPKAKISKCVSSYEKHGIIRNVIDLMGDFATQGIDLVHPVKSIEKFYKEWFESVDGYFVTERLANQLCNPCNVIIRRMTGKISRSYVDQIRKQAYASTNPNQNLVKLAKLELPLRYVFLNPITLEVENEDIAAFFDADNVVYSVRIPETVIKAVQFPNDETAKAIVASLPPEILIAIRKGKTKILLNNLELIKSFYKKNSWQIWATPMLSSVLPDLNILEKMKLADLSALDGAISQIRIWKLGSLEHKIMPSAAAISKLSSILVNNSGGGIIDLVWGPELEFQEVTTNLHNFLGETKYIPVLNAIFAGLGVPPLFSGSSNQGGFTNNFLAIKTLIERLNYIRKLITKVWNHEIKLVQQAMGFKKPAKLVFDRMTLNDESSILNLLMSLVDRNYLSIEYVQEVVGASPEVERMRIAREEKDRIAGKIPKKAGPFHNPQDIEEMRKMFVQQGLLTPSEVGVEVQQKKSGEQSMLEFNKKKELQLQKEAPKPAKPIGKSGQGRTPGKKDKVKRKQKVVKPARGVTKASLIDVLSWTSNMQKLIASHFTPIYLKSVNKDNLRQLTSKEAMKFEDFKFSVLSNIQYGQDVTEETLNSMVGDISIPLETPPLMSELLDSSIKKFKIKNKEVTFDDVRRLQAFTYSLCHADAALPKQEAGDSNNDLPTL